MPQSRLELVSSHGDQTLSQVRFVAHGSSLAEGIEIQRHGLSFIEARATVSTSLIQALGYATDPVRRGYSSSDVPTTDDPGMITIVAIPADFHLGYATFTNAYIDRALKQVQGAPLRYAGARKQLAFYRAVDTEPARVKVEGEVLSGSPLVDHPSFKVEPRYIVGGFDPDINLKNLLTNLEVSAKSFELVDFASLERSLQLLFVVREPAQAVLVPTLVRDMILGTIEAVIMSRLRMIRWQGLTLLGYRFYEGGEEVTMAGVADIAEQHRRMDECERQLASSKLFDGELAWLKTYGTRALAVMRVELEAAELEAD
jgi:hypothetical protein